MQPQKAEEQGNREWAAEHVGGGAHGLGVNWWHRVRRERAADVTVYFHWLVAYSKVRLENGEDREAGYNLVVWNQGPSAARNVAITIYDPAGNKRTWLIAEFPLERLDPGARYPIPWVLDDDSQGKYRRFKVDIIWRDGNGARKETLPLRRGQIGT
jgi:hypothetical protein